MMELHEMRAAYAEGVRRNRAANARGGSHRFGWTPSPAEESHVNGCAVVAEFAVGKVTGRRVLGWGVDEPDNPEAGDLEGGVSVRWTRRLDGSLIIHSDEADHLRAVLVVGEPPAIRICGWRLVAECKRENWWRDHVRHPAFFVPQFELAPIDDLVVL